MNIVGYRCEILSGAYSQVTTRDPVTKREADHPVNAVYATAEAIKALSKGLGTPQPVDFWWLLCMICLGEEYALDAAAVRNWNRCLKEHPDLDCFLVEEGTSVTLQCRQETARYRDKLREQYPLESIPRVASREFYDEMSDAFAGIIDAGGIKTDDTQFGTGKRRINLD